MLGPRSRWGQAATIYDPRVADSEFDTDIDVGRPARRMRAARRRGVR
jgi:hypothetical protein